MDILHQVVFANTVEDAGFIKDNMTEPDNERNFSIRKKENWQFPGILTTRSWIFSHWKKQKISSVNL